ncbi:MAG TPA: hypothetical protein PLJ38_00785, partial [bacterium]|nr:hypothetical protein [bacterium]
MKTKKKNIAFYISSHGFGHFARAIIIIKKLIKDFNIFIKSDIALKKFEYELSTENRKYKVIPAAFDVGCIQKSFVDIDIEKTLQTAEIVQLQNEKNYSSEKKFLIDNNIDFILADAASYPLKLGAELNIPRFLISNFTWYDIYSNFPKVFTKKYSTLISAIKYEYSCATAQMCPGLAIENDYIKQKYNFGLITSPSKNIKSELYEKYNIKNKITAFIYFGNFDNKIINWHNLKNNTNAVFLTKDDIPIKSENLIKI